ncbi:MAG: hypothetical protein KGI49_00730 [Patescibacteria group bacterium]|nr:hypothetical protein [Patescibacteria group bacterium]
MSTISVPLPAVLEEFINDMVKSGEAANKADVVRRALMKYRENQAIEEVLKASREVREGKYLEGDLDKLAKQFKPWR